jgi:hypothetical protein
MAKLKEPCPQFQRGAGDVPTVEERQFGLDTRTRNRTVQHPMRGIKRAHPLGEKFASFIQQALALVRTLASTAGESIRACKP